jgi:hypothetical protein
MTQILYVLISLAAFWLGVRCIMRAAAACSALVELVKAGPHGAYERVWHRPELAGRYDSLLGVCAEERYPSTPRWAQRWER